MEGSENKVRVKGAISKMSGERAEFSDEEHGEEEARRRLLWKRRSAGSGGGAAASKQLLLGLLVGLISLALVSDLRQFARRLAKRGEGSPCEPLAAWASWIGEVPTAAELYGDAASEMPTTESFEDDDEDEELDASASNEYPDNENDESYEDPEEGEQESESRVRERWVEPGALRSRTRREAPNFGDQAFWANLVGRRKKRDAEDRLVLASRRAAQQRKAERSAAAAASNDDFAVDDGDEDAWVHDGVDDIHIDPETRRAATEHSADESSIDADYDPHQRQASVVNRTRVTTIAEVIPVNVDPFDGESEQGAAASSKEATRLNSAGQPVEQQQQQQPRQASIVPAAHLTIEQAQQLVAEQAAPLFWGAESAQTPLIAARSLNSHFRSQRHLAAAAENDSSKNPPLDGASGTNKKPTQRGAPAKK